MPDAGSACCFLFSELDRLAEGDWGFSLSEAKDDEGVGALVSAGDGVELRSDAMSLALARDLVFIAANCGENPFQRSSASGVPCDSFPAVKYEQRAY